jgi:potassium-transporting ATPase KdpC subunit
MVTTSASGFDPHITPANAEFQLARVAKARGITMDQVRSVVAKHSQGRTFGVLGEARVNVLELNLDLDEHFPAGTRAKVD